MILWGGQAQWPTFRQQLRARNPEIIFLGTTPFTNVPPPAQAPWMQDAWYLRDSNGNKVNWWLGQAFVPNLFYDGYLTAAVGQADLNYGSLVRDDLAEGFMFDSVVGCVTWLGNVDTNLDGIPDTPGDVDHQWQQRQNVFFDMVQQQLPGAYVIANDVDLRHAPHLNGRLFEGATLLDRLPRGDFSPHEVIHTLKSWTSSSLQPSTTFAISGHPIGAQWWRLGSDGMVLDRVTTGELDRIKTDFPRMRLGLLTTMMSDAYYAYDLGATWYGMPFWFAEFDAPLGNPLGDSVEIFDTPPVTVLDWQAGQSTDKLYVYPGVNVTPSGIESDISDPTGTWYGLLHTDPAQVPLLPGSTYRVIADWEIISEAGILQASVRTDAGGWALHDKGVRWADTGSVKKWRGEKWHVETTVVPDNFDDYAARFDQFGSGSVRLTKLKVLRMNNSYFRRDFQGGSAFLNPTHRPITITLNTPMRRIRDSKAPRYVVDIDEITGYSGATDPEQVLRWCVDPTRLRVKSSFLAGAGWELRNDDGHQYANTYMVAQQAGRTATWDFTAPSADIYTIYAWQKGGADLTNLAVYDLSGPATRARSKVNQRIYNGQWVKLFSARLRKGARYKVVLKSGADGLTIADAIRVESRARFNDGSLVTQLKLDALDGAVLLNN